MIAIIPLIFDNKLERRFWQNNIGLKYVQRLLHEIEAIDQIDSILLLSDVGADWKSLKSDRTKIISVNPDIWENHSNQQCEILSCTAHVISEAIENHFNSSVCDKTNYDKAIFIDVRNPSLNGSTIRQALNQYENSSISILISVMKSCDHPCQYQTYYRLIDAGSTYFEHSNKSDNDTHTKLFTIKNETSTTNQITLCFPEFDNLTPTHLYILPFQTSGNKSIGAPRMLTINEVDNGRITLELENFSILDGLLYVLLKSVQWGEYDIASHMEPLENLWYFEESGIAIRSSDGAKILGRQAFPQIFEIDGSIVITKTTLLPEVQRICEKCEAESFVVEKPTIHILSEYDLVLARALIINNISCYDKRIL
ncbi:MAG: hypothetical protein HQK65_11430 [Desulfamplus sp.]|nr:hypothetical protein [Desulfamplus sp.]